MSTSDLLWGEIYGVRGANGAMMLCGYGVVVVLKWWLLIRHDGDCES